MLAALWYILKVLGVLCLVILAAGVILILIACIVNVMKELIKKNKN